MKIAVEGCCHGELDTIYDTLEYLEKKNSIKVDLLLICGDFQSVRNKADMKCMAVPPKHQKMNSFYKYYSGEKTAPVLTVFIGGNHEASNYLQELPYGGWVAPKIYYMGYAGVLQFGGVRIGGISGIFKGRDYMKGHYEHPPYTEDTKRSAYHMRVFDVFRLKQLKKHIDIFMSHDWPKGIHNYGNVEYLLRKKSYFRDEIEKNELGNPVAMDLLHQLQPTYWFSAHLHVKFAALVQHTEDANSKFTKFLSLDKCLPKRQFLQVLDIPHDTSKPLQLQLDPEWLAILKCTNPLLSISRHNHYPGGSGPGERQDYSATQEEINAVISDFGGDMSIPENFEQTVPVFDPAKSKKANTMPEPRPEVNKQTTLLCSMLDLTNPNAVFLGIDSTIQLPQDDSMSKEEGGNGNDSDSMEDDYESEASFISVTDSERSFSDRSLSFLSVGNESFSSVGNPEELNLDESLKDSKGSDDSKKSIEDIDNDNDEFREIMAAQQVQKTLRRSLSESLPKPKLDTSKNNSASSEEDLEDAEFAEILAAQKKAKETKCASSEEDLEDSEFAEILAAQKNAKETKCASSEEDLEDLEFAEILAAQKKVKETKCDTESESETSKTSILSDSSIDCKSLHINDNDPELLEMLQAQKLRKADTVNVNKLMEVSLENSDVEFQDIVHARKQTFDDDGLEDGQPDLKNLLPAYQSSPLVSIEDRVDQNFTEKDVSPTQGKGGLKRGEGEKTNQSPAMKKFRRRNVDLYSDNSTEEEN